MICNIEVLMLMLSCEYAALQIGRRSYGLGITVWRKDMVPNALLFHGRRLVWLETYMPSSAMALMRTYWVWTPF